MNDTIRVNCELQCDDKIRRLLSGADSRPVSPNSPESTPLMFFDLFPAMSLKATSHGISHLQRDLTISIRCGTFVSSSEELYSTQWAHVCRLTHRPLAHKSRSRRVHRRQKSE